MTSGRSWHIGRTREVHLSNHFPVKLLDNDISPSDSVRNLGVIFDSDFSFHKHISNICKSCFYHIRDLRRIRRHLPLSTAKTISNSLISSRLDYCNSLINNIAKQDLSKLQRVQNCLARVVLREPRFSPSLPLLKQLHWLPVNYRIKFKLSTLTYRALAMHQPPYLASLLHCSNVPRQLRSSTSQQLSIPRTKLNLGKRAFSVAAPIIWNVLPTTLKSLQNCFSTLNSRRPLKLVMTPACPRLLDMINDFVLLRFWDRAPRGFKRYRSYIILLLLLLLLHHIWWFSVRCVGTFLGMVIWLWLELVEV